MADGPAGNEVSRDEHAEWHDLAVASLLDPDLAASERSVAERLLTTCATCACLHDDLIALAAATRALPAAKRTRDFSLTAGDATRVRPTVASPGEPRTRDTRLAGEMPLPKVDHRTHDTMLVASLLDRATRDPDRPRAEAQVAACNDCAALHRDLLALREATTALTPPPRVRDYAISADDARRLRGTGWRRLIAIFGSTRDAFSRPLAIGLTTIGLAGLLVTTFPWTLPGGPSAASAPTLGQAVGGAGSGATSESLGGSKGLPGDASTAPATAEAPVAATAGPSIGPAAAALPVPSAAPSRAAAVAPPSTEPAASGEALDTFAGAAQAPVAPPGAAGASSDGTQVQGTEHLSSNAVGQATSATDHAAVTALAGLLFVAGVALFLLRWAGRRV